MFLLNLCIRYNLQWQTDNIEQDSGSEDMDPGDITISSSSIVRQFLIEEYFD